MARSEPTTPAPGWIRDLPPIVKQENLTCWAAAAFAWVKVTPRSPAAWWLHSVNDALEQFDAWAPEDDETKKRSGLSMSRDGDTPSGIEILSASLGMEIALFGQTKTGASVKGVPPIKTLSGRFLLDRLRDRGHLYLIYEPQGASFSHANVVYAVGAADSQDAAMLVMETAKGFPAYRRLTLEDLHRCRVAIVGAPDPAARHTS